MFARPDLLWWTLAALAAAAACYGWGAARRREAAAAFGRAASVDRLVPEEAARRRGWRAALRLSALALAGLALAGPQWGVELVAAQSSLRTVVVAVDVSASMLAEDVRPNRLAKAKSELALLLEGLRGDRVGVLAFAGQAGLMCPVTTDVDAAKQVLRALEVEAVPEPGTALGTALRSATAALSRYPGGRAVVLLTDGEDHRTDPRGAAREAAEAGVRVFTVGIGSPDGGPVPVRDPDSGEVKTYKKDPQGSTVISRLGEQALIDMAAATGGAYFRSTPGEDEVSEILKRVSQLEAGAGKGTAANRYRNRYLGPLAAAFVLLLAELLLPLTARRRQPLAERTVRRAAPAALALALTLAAAAPARAASPESALRRGNRLYEKGLYEEALEEFRRSERADDPRPAFNAGDALFRKGELPQAAESFSEAGRRARAAASAARVRSQAAYNEGAAMLAQGKNKEAVEAFRRAVVLDPSDADARHNLAVALRQLKQEGGKGGQKPPPPSQDKGQPPPKDAPPKPESPGSRPRQQGMSREEAQRLLEAVKDKEKAARPKPATGKGGPSSKEDW